MNSGKKNVLSMSIAAAFAVVGCGGSGGGDLDGASATASAVGAGAEQTGGLKKASAVGSQITVMARGSLAANREHGELRLEGKDYIVLDGDVINFRHAT